MCTVFSSYADAKSNTDLYPDKDLTSLELLGKYVFFDKVSEPERMACVTCHDPAYGWTNPKDGVNLQQVTITGANPHTAGGIKPPSNCYASLIEPFGPCTNGAISGFCGGNFWDGRAEGNEFPPEFPAGATKHIGNEVFFTTSGDDLRDDFDIADYATYFGPTADQALNPMPNPVEQNIERQAVCQQVAATKYAELYELAWGVPIDCSDNLVTQSAPDVDDPEKAFDISFKRLMLAVCAYQASDQVNSFSSKRDMALVNDSDGTFPLDGFTAQENLGHDLFYNTFLTRTPGLPITNCSVCHSDHPEIFTGNPPDTGVEPQQLYSDQGYHNIGVPSNPEIPDGDTSNGLFSHTGDAGDIGSFKTPILRNVDKRSGTGSHKAYTHNGWFKSLESLIHFYNTADVEGATADTFGVTRCPDNITTEEDALKNNCWPAPAFANSVIGIAIGDMGLSLEQEAAIVAYLNTLTDIYTPKAPKPWK